MLGVREEQVEVELRVVSVNFRSCECSVVYIKSVSRKWKFT